MNSNKTPLMVAVMNGEKEIVIDFLVEKKVDPNEISGETAETPLMRAAYKGHTEIANMLINKGAQLNLVDEVGDTALDYAIVNKKLPMIRLLLSHGADIKHPKNLFNFLQECKKENPDVEKPNPDVEFSLKCYYHQLENKKKIAVSSFYGAITVCAVALLIFVMCFPPTSVVGFLLFSLTAFGSLGIGYWAGGKTQKEKNNSQPFSSYQSNERNQITEINSLTSSNPTSTVVIGQTFQLQQNALLTAEPASQAQEITSQKSELSFDSKQERENNNAKKQQSNSLLNA